jgi:hypothetical protein
MSSAHATAKLPFGKPMKLAGLVTPALAPRA